MTSLFFRKRPKCIPFLNVTSLAIPPEVTNRLKVVHVQIYTPSYLSYYWELWHLDGTWNPLLSLFLCPRTNHQYHPGSQRYGGSQLLSEPVWPSQEQPHPEPLRPAACAPEPLSQPQPHPAQPQPPAARQPHQLTALDWSSTQTGRWTSAPSSSRTRKLWTGT